MYIYITYIYIYIYIYNKGQERLESRMLLQVSKFHTDAIFRHTFYYLLKNRKHKNLNIIKKILIWCPLLHVQNQ